MPHNWIKMGTFHLSGHPNCSRVIFGKMPFFDPFLTHQPIFKAFWDFRGGGAKRATTRSKCAKDTCFGIPPGLGSFLKKVFFFGTYWTLLTQFGTHLFGLVVAACRRPVGQGTGV